MNFFKVGDIIQFSPGYHTKNPYYAEVIKSSFFFNRIVTYIPGQHTLEISERRGNWGYHIRRMTVVGTKATHGHLLYNQPLD